MDRPVSYDGSFNNWKSTTIHWRNNSALPMMGLWLSKMNPMKLQQKKQRLSRTWCFLLKWRRSSILAHKLFPLSILAIFCAWSHGNETQITFFRQMWPNDLSVSLSTTIPSFQRCLHRLPAALSSWYVARSIYWLAVWMEWFTFSKSTPRITSSKSSQ